VEGDLDHVFLGFVSQAVKPLYGRLAAFFPTPLRMAEILSEPQHPGFRKMYRFLEDEHLIGVLADRLCWFCRAVACFEDACFCFGLVDFPHAMSLSNP